MSHAVLIQREEGEFHNANGFNAWQGFVERGYEVRFADWTMMASDSVAVDRETITVGSVAFVRRALRRIGIEPAPLGYPARLQGYLGRRVWPTTWGEVRARIGEEGEADAGPVFVKPREQDKAFTGYVVSAFRDLIRTAGWPDAMPLWAAEPVQFASEWRYFVCEGEVIGVGHAKGDPFRYPKPDVVRAAVEDFAPEAPAAYGIDFGVTDGGATLLVEVNEGFSLGCYGLGPLAYSGLLIARWRELAGSPLISES